MMKMCITVFVVLMFQTNFSLAQDKVSKREERQNKRMEEYRITKALVESLNFEFTGDRALPHTGSSVDLISNPNYLRVSGDSARASLPFFGRAYSASYGGDEGGIRFENVMEEYTLNENNKKGSLTISFKIKGTSDSFTCQLNISGSGSTMLNVSSINRAPISYQGRISSPEAK